jgi:hypothetical protein
VRIEKREVESPTELTTLITEVLEGELEGFRLIDQVDLSAEDIEIGILAADAEGHVFVAMAKERLGDSLILSYGKHLEWFKSHKERISSENPQLDWTREPGIIMVADSFSPHILTLVPMLGVDPARCYSMRCLGIGSEKGLLVEALDLPRVERAAPAAPVAAPAAEGDLLTSAVNGVVAIAEDLSVSASFGYVSESLDWVPVAALRSRRGTIWIESGPGKWTTKRIEDDESLQAALERVRASYKDVVKTKGEAKNIGDDELSEAERKSLRWE